MNKDYMDKLISDIQQYLSEEEYGVGIDTDVAPLAAADPAPRWRLRRPFLVGTVTLLSACAVGSITVTILLLGIVGAPGGESLNTIWMLATGGCGIFFSTMLVSTWKRLLLLGQIERNIRLILETKQAANDLMEQYIQKMT